MKTKRDVVAWIVASARVVVTHRANSETPCAEGRRKKDLPSVNLAPDTPHHFKIAVGSSNFADSGKLRCIASRVASMRRVVGAKHTLSKDSRSCNLRSPSECSPLLVITSAGCFLRKARVRGARCRCNIATRVPTKRPFQREIGADRSVCLPMDKNIKEDGRGFAGAITGYSPWKR